jgi:hypothetical protein
MNEESFPLCKHCQHPGESHDEEFGNCGHLGLTETGHDICECPGYEEPFEPSTLDAVVDQVLSYRPKPKSKGAKRRTRRAKKAKAENG